MELEGVGPIAVGGVPLEILGEVDDVDGLKGALFDADAAADAEGFGEVGDFGLGADLDAELAELDDGAGLLALLLALFGLAFLGVDDGDTGEVVAGRVGLFGGLLLGRHGGLVSLGLVISWLEWINWEQQLLTVDGSKHCNDGDRPRLQATAI